MFEFTVGGCCFWTLDREWSSQFWLSVSAETFWPDHYLESLGIYAINELGILRPFVPARPNVSATICDLYSCSHFTPPLVRFLCCIYSQSLCQSDARIMLSIFTATTGGGILIPINENCIIIIHTARPIIINKPLVIRTIEFARF